MKNSADELLIAAGYDSKKGSNDISIETLSEEALYKFKDENLLTLIWEELSKTHIGDNNLKLTIFLSCISALLKNPKRRMSSAITANSSEGKDNIIKTSLGHMPRDSFIFLTSGTQATIEDDIQDKRIIAFSELNVNRENGANKYLVEIIKQKTEGGTSAIKKDMRSGLKTARHEEGEQCTILYGTTEAAMDEEMQTRFIKGTIETDSIRIKKVNDNTLDTFSNMDKLLKDSIDEDSWIRTGLTYFLDQKDQPEVLIPYAKYLKEKVSGNNVFDSNNPRSQRDVKRILSLTCAMTYLLQEQREIIYSKEQKLLISEPQDLINILFITGELFNQSYSGIDKRLMNVLSIIKKSDTEWVDRCDIEKELDKAKNTIKAYCKTLSEEGLIEGIKGKSLNDTKNTNIYDSNKIYYRERQKDIKKPLIGCQLSELKFYLEEKTGKTIDTFSFNCNSEDKKDVEGVKNKGVKIQKNVHETKEVSSPRGIDTPELTPLADNGPSKNSEIQVLIGKTGLAKEYTALLEENPDTRIIIKNSLEAGNKNGIK